MNSLVTAFQKFPIMVCYVCVHTCVCIYVCFVCVVCILKCVCVGCVGGM